MSNNNETTTKFKVDISELKKAMQEAKRSISVANSEFKEASSSMDDWSKSTDGISAKLKQLDSNLKSQKTILSSLEKQYDAVVAEQGEGSAAADRLKVAINNQKAAINKTEREITNYEGALKEVGEAEKIASKTGRDVADVLDDMGNKADDAGDGFTTLKGTIATFAGNMLTNLVGSIKDGISSFMGLADETREYRTELGKLETAFTTAGHTTDTATKTYKDLYAVLGDEGQSVEAANLMAKLCDSEKELADWTNIATGVYGTFGASLPIESLAEAANETSKTGQITGALADALNWAGVSEDEFQESLDGCNGEQERQALITETLNGLYSDAAKKYEETNKSVMDANRANSDYTDTLATMGEKIEPVTTTIKEGFNGLLQKLLELVSGVDMEAFTSKIEEGFRILSDEVLPAVKDGLGWIKDNSSTIIAGLAGIAAGFVAFKVVTLIQGIVGAFKAWKLATEGMTIAQRLLNLAMNMNPIGIVIALIAGLVAAFVVLWNKSDSFRNFWIGLWEKIKTFCSSAISTIGGFFTETVPAFIDKMVGFFSQLPAKIWKWLVNTINKVITWRNNMVNKAREAALSFINKVVEFVKQLPAKVWTWLVNTINKVITWRNNMVNKAREAALSFVNKVVEFVKQLPAKVWTWLVNVVSKVTTWASNLASKGREAAVNFVNKVVDFVKQLPAKVWTWLVNTASKVASWGSSLASKGREAAQKLLTAVVEKVQEIPGKMLSIGSDIVKGLWNGINNTVDWLKSKISGFVGNVTDWLKKFFEIGSPSKLMAREIGRWLPEGIAVGVDDNAKSVLSSLKSLAVNSLGAAREGLSSASSSLGSTGSSNTTGSRINNFYQTINSPKQLNRLEIYRQSKNLLGFAGGVS